MTPKRYRGESREGEFEIVWTAVLGVFLKEWRQVNKYQSWVISTVEDIVSFTLPLILASYALRSTVGTDEFQALTRTASPEAYLAAGASVWLWLISALWSTGSVLRTEMRQGTLEVLLTSPVSILVWAFSVSVFRLALSAPSVMFHVLIIAVASGINLLKVNWLLVLVTAVIGSLALGGLGLAYGGVIIRYKDTGAFGNLLRALFWVLSGSTYSLSVFPRYLQVVAALLPTTYVIDLTRCAFLNAGAFGTARGIVVLIIEAGVLSSFGLWVLRRLLREARTEGTLSTF